jgi:hypothetical protein
MGLLVITAQLFGVKFVGGDEVASHCVKTKVVAVAVNGPDIHDSIVFVEDLDCLGIDIVRLDVNIE